MQSTSTHSSGCAQQKINCKNNAATTHHQVENCPLAQNAVKDVYIHTSYDACHDSNQCHWSVTDTSMKYACQEWCNMHPPHTHATPTAAPQPKAGPAPAEQQAVARTETDITKLTLVTP